MITFFLFILGENIKSAYDEIVTKYGISEKVTAVVTDNGANVVKAFSVSLLVQVEDGEDEDEGDEFSMVQDEDSDTESESEHLRCACHTVQLVVKDGLKKCPTAALKKANRSSSTHDTLSAVQRLWKITTPLIYNHVTPQDGAAS